jgi:hypothetical protein
MVMGKALPSGSWNVSVRVSVMASPNHVGVNGSQRDQPDEAITIDRLCCGGNIDFPSKWWRALAGSAANVRVCANVM